MNSATYMELVIKYQHQLHRMYCLRVCQGYLNIEVKAVIFSIQVIICLPRLTKKTDINFIDYMVNSVSGQDEPNPAILHTQDLLCPTRKTSPKAI